MTKQEVFDTGYRAIIAQGKPGMGRSRTCVYYDDITGLRCIAGLLMPKEAAKNVQDGGYGSVNDFTGPDRDLPHGVPDWFNAHAYLIRQMQIAHDSSTYNVYESRYRTDEEFIAEFTQKMRDLAAFQDLDTSVMEAVEA